MAIPEHFYDDSLRISGVYAITCSSNGKIYIGSSVNISLRWRGHMRHLASGTHHCLHLQNAWRKYGPERFTFSILEIVDREALRMREQVHMDAVHRGKRFNSTPTAGSLLGFKMGAESLERMRIAHTGFRHSEETKARARVARAGIATRPAGWKMSAEGRANISAALSGKPLSPERRAKSIAKLRGATHFPPTQSEKQKLFEAHRKLTDSQVEEARNSYLAGQTMDSIAADMGCSRRAVSRAVRGDGHYGSIGTPVTAVIKRSPSEETKRKLSSATKGRPKSSETRERMRLAWIDRRNKAA